MNLKPYLLFVIVFQINSTLAQKVEKVYETENLRIDKLTENTFIHISYLNTDDFGRVACNGMIVVDDGESIVFDTPTDDAASDELIKWLESFTKSKVKALVVTHFHSDCLGGIAKFHERGIASYANNKTIELAAANGEIVPKNGFDEYLELKVGKKKVKSEFIGEGHTRDNTIGYFPSEKVLFGGCLIKGNDAGKGYLGDANVNEWSNTVEKIRSKYKKAAFIVPGHGKPGGQNLLDFTIGLFR
ncbi:MAG: subclass B1 metallo-beta-lactamase [Cyclobacteriaceae bacterium]